MQGSIKTRWRSQHSPLGRAYRTVAITIVASATALLVMQGCPGDMVFSGFSSPSSSPSFEAGRPYVWASEPFQSNYLSVRAQGFSSFLPAPAAGSLGESTGSGKAAMTTAVSSDRRDPLNPSPGGYLTAARPGMVLLLTMLILMLLIRNCAVDRQPSAGAMLRAGPRGRVIGGRTHGGSRRPDAHAVRDDRPADHINVPPVCIGYLPQAIRRQLTLRDAGVVL